jgi:hypothetical protein
MAVSIAAVEAAITSIMEDGQSVTIGDTTYNQANLIALIALRDSLLETIGRTSKKRPVFRAFNLSGMGY